MKIVTPSSSIARGVVKDFLQAEDIIDSVIHAHTKQVGGKRNDYPRNNCSNNNRNDRKSY